MEPVVVPTGQSRQEVEKAERNRIHVIAWYELR